jgi:hypothetical protein
MTQARTLRAPSSLTDKPSSNSRPYITGFFASVPLAFYLAFRLTPTATRLYELLCGCVEEEATAVRRSKLHTRLGCSGASVRRGLSALEEAGLINRVQHDDLDVIELVNLRGVTLEELKTFESEGFETLADVGMGGGARVLMSTQITRDKELSPTDRRVLGFYLAVAGKETGNSWWNHKRVAKALALRPDVLSRSRGVLAQLGYIHRSWLRDGRQLTRVKAPPEEVGSKLPTGEDKIASPSYKPKTQPDTQKHAHTREDSKPLISVPAQDVAQVIEAVEAVVGDIADPDAHLVETFIARRLRRGQTVATLVANLAAYAARARYRLPASRLLRGNAIDQWTPAIEDNPNRKLVRKYISEGELAFEREIRVGAHESKPVLTAQLQAQQDELRREWLELPLELPDCPLPAHRQDETIDRIWRQTRGEIEAFMDWISPEVWAGRVGIAQLLAYFKQPEEFQTAFEPHLRRHRCDVVFEDFKAQLVANVP